MLLSSVPVHSGQCSVQKVVSCDNVFTPGFPSVSSIRFMVSGFILGSFIHVDLSFVQNDKCGTICVLHVDALFD